MKDLQTALAESIIGNFPDPFQRAMEFILPHETEFQTTRDEDGKKVSHYGDYDFVRTENVPGDSGGQTRYGIDKQAHPHVDIGGLDLNGALAIYWSEWQEHNLDDLPANLSIAAFDVWVNGGHANLWIQQAYNAVYGPSLAEDGVLGPKTIQALEEVPDREDDILRHFLGLRQQRFIRLAKQPQLRQFLNGWTQRNEDLAAFLGVA